MYSSVLSWDMVDIDITADTDGHHYLLCDHLHPRYLAVHHVDVE
ncbi:hypothetical protein [[Clostridium] innocuum]|nr:hypothetical protein [[Clostridium] innocuum]